jgi:hypothetical protein
MERLEISEKGQDPEPIDTKDELFPGGSEELKSAGNVRQAPSHQLLSITLEDALGEEREDADSDY